MLIFDWTLPIEGALFQIGDRAPVSLEANRPASKLITAVAIASPRCPRPFERLEAQPAGSRWFGRCIFVAQRSPCSPWRSLTPSALGPFLRREPLRWKILAPAGTPRGLPSQTVRPTTPAGARSCLVRVAPWCSSALDRASWRLSVVRQALVTTLRLLSRTPVPSATAIKNTK